MTVAYEGVDLPRFSRHIARTHPAGARDDTGRRRSFGGLLGRFAGVLELRIGAHDWPPAAVAHLALDRLVATTGHAPVPSEPAASTAVPPPDETPTGAADGPGDKRGVDEPRVREVLRSSPTASAEPASPPDSGPSGGRGHRGPTEVGVLLDNPWVARPAEAVGGRPADGTDADGTDADGTEPLRSAGARDTPTGRGTPGTSQSDPTGPADRPDEAVPPARTAVVRRQVADSARTPRAGPRGGGDPDASPADGAPSSDDRSRVAVNHPTVTHPGDRPGRTPHPAMRVSRHLREPDRPDATPTAGAPRDDSDRALAVTDRSEPTAPRPWDPSDGRPDDPLADARRDDTAARMEPLVGAAAAGGWLPAPTSGATPTARPGGRAGEPPDERRDGPPLVVRGPAQPRRGDPDARNGGTPVGRGDARGRPGSTADPRDTTDGHRRDDLPVGLARSGANTDGTADRSPRGSAGQRDDRTPDRFDELVDVDDLVARLSRALERAARIERERRGR